MTMVVVVVCLWILWSSSLVINANIHSPLILQKLEGPSHSLILLQLNSIQTSNIINDTRSLLATTGSP